MIALEQVTKVYSRGRPEEHTALAAVDLTVGAGERLVLMGPSGSGKTTLLTVLGTLLRPTSGRLRLEGRDLTRLPEKALASIRRRTFGFLFQEPHLVRGLRVIENVLLPALPVHEPGDGLRERALSLLGKFGLEKKTLARAETLSPGEAQRAGLARALLLDPQVLIADEPTAHLDTARARELIAFLGSLASEGKTLVIASHDPLVGGAGFVNRVLAMRDGRILEGSSSR